MTSTNRYVVDSWAWVEYLRGSDGGRRVERYVDEGAQLLTHVFSVAEVASKARRSGGDHEGAVRRIASLSTVHAPDRDDAHKAGLLHADVRKSSSNFSLADAFVLQLARKRNAKVLTGDPDFKGIREAILLRD